MLEAHKICVPFCVDYHCSGSPLGHSVDLVTILTLDDIELVSIIALVVIVVALATVVVLVIVVMLVSVSALVTVGARLSL